MNQTEKFIATVQSAGMNGVTTEELCKLLKRKEQSVYSAAYAAKKNGFKFINTRGIYLYKGEPAQSTALIPAQETVMPTSFFGIHLSQSVTSRMDPASKADLIEQLRRAQMHVGIAKSIIESHKLAKELEEKI